MSHSDSEAGILSASGLSIAGPSNGAIHTRPIWVRRGEVVGLRGPNGSGKTTLLRALAGQTMPSAGRIWLSGHDVTALGASARARVGLRFLPQVENVFTNLTVAENLAIASTCPANLQKARSKLGSLLPHLDMAISTALLSGGERQILAIVMLISQKTDIYLLDEPYAGLDTRRVDAVRTELLSCLAADDAAALIVDHDNGRLTADCDRVIEVAQVLKQN